LELEYSVETCRKLEKEFLKTALYRPMRIKRYEEGTELEYHVTGVEKATLAKVRLSIDKFVGGGFAGQVYRVKVLDIQSGSGTIEGLESGKIIGMKILIPPSFFSKLFRNFIYWIGFQGPFQLQVNPAAARAGAIWQKFIQRGAKLRFGDEQAVVNTHATFVDETMGSCGELREWVEGRTWRLEVDPYLDLLGRWIRKRKVESDHLGSPEYRAKRTFMRDFVNLLHAMGAHEFARQYEWSTCKSQPNCLKRSETERDPSAGLVAVDFQAGLALLPFLPMSPGDFKLIMKGFLRGSLVQFDRGNVNRLERFIAAHPDAFAGTEHMFEELKEKERIYRNSIPDITHNHFLFFYSRQLWSTLLRSTVTGWRVRNLIDEKCENTLRRNIVLTALYNFLGFIPIAGGFVRRIWGQPFWRNHYWKILTSINYLRRAVQGKLIEKIIDWHRDGRIGEVRALKMAKHLWLCYLHLPLSILPAGLHHFLTDPHYFRERLEFIFLRPIRLYFNADLRSQWLIDMVTEGKKKHILTEEDAFTILSQAKEPFIQKYLKSLAVHICTLPITQVISVSVAIIYIATHPEVPKAEAYAIGVSIIALFQVVPISPGSLVRGLYVLFLVISEKNFKDYNIAVFLGFFKYIGYLAFPIQMTYRYPALARFMAGHWATDAVHIVPVFGERGALLEHFIYRLFYNWPLTIRRRMQERNEIRSNLEPRYWHIPVVAIIGTLIFYLANLFYYKQFETLSGLKEIWLPAMIVPLLIGAAVTLWTRGAAMWKRIVSAAICGSTVALLYTILFVSLGYSGTMSDSAVFFNGVWKVFAFTIGATLGALVMELFLPGKKLE
jgi:hypothetical protein